MNAIRIDIPTSRTILRMITIIENVVPFFLSSSFSPNPDKSSKTPETTPPKTNPRGISICPLKKQNKDANNATKVTAKVQNAITNELGYFSKSFLII